MWFTRISLKNPVFATMIMLAFVVMGLFAFQRLKVDQFPNIDLPVVVVITEYPGASPEIVESEVTKKIEESVNTIAGISALTSRSYETQSVVVIEFQLNMDGRKAADDVREKVAAIRPMLRDEVKEPRFFDLITQHGANGCHFFSHIVGCFAAIHVELKLNHHHRLRLVAA